MGTLIATVSGLTTFLLVNSSSHFVEAIFFGVVIFGMTYGAFAWRRSESDISSTKVTHSPTSSSAQPTARGRSTQHGDMLDDELPPPKEVGLILAMSLHEGHPPDKIQPKEMALVRSAGLSARDYAVERFILLASAAAYAVTTSLSEDHRREVAIGFMSWFVQEAAIRPDFAMTYQSFKEKLPTYMAAGKDDQRSNHLPSISRVSLAFGSALTGRSSNPPGAESACDILALTVGDAYWSAQVEGSMMLFRRAGILDASSEV